MIHFNKLNQYWNSISVMLDWQEDMSWGWSSKIIITELTFIRWLRSLKSYQTWKQHYHKLSQRSKLRKFATLTEIALYVTRFSRILILSLRLYFSNFPIAQHILVLRLTFKRWLRLNPHMLVTLDLLQTVRIFVCYTKSYLTLPTML